MNFQISTYYLHTTNTQLARLAVSMKKVSFNDFTPRMIWAKNFTMNILHKRFTMNIINEIHEDLHFIQSKNIFQKPFFKRGLIVPSMWFWSVSWSTNCPVYLSLFLDDQKKICSVSGIFGQSLNFFWSSSDFLVY